ncbi:MAG: hypothetical protein WBB34_07975 [Xanthobacteraceae bacterium]
MLIDADPLRSACQWAELGGLGFPVKEILFNPARSVADWASSVKRVQGQFVIIDTPPSDAAMAATDAGGYRGQARSPS